jgi:acyl-CoA dehydrogenase
MRATIEHCAGTVETLLDGGPAVAFSSLGLAIEMNQLKLTASELVTKIVGQALSICGMAGYQADGPYSVARHLRDAYSAGLMIGNERLRAANAVMLLAQKAI